VTVSYTKNSDTLTAQTLEQQSASQPDTAATGGTTQWIAYALVGVGVLLIGGGVLWYVRTTREDAPRPRARRGGAAKADRFCTQCGQSVSSQDRFCRHCGARLRGV
jgi:LPXTG-motif cell wall-anchored protein